MHSLTHSQVGFGGKCRSVVVIDPLVPAIITQWVEDTSGFHNLCLTKVSSHTIENPNHSIMIREDISVFITLFLVKVCGS